MIRRTGTKAMLTAAAAAMMWVGSLSADTTLFNNFGPDDAYDLWTGWTIGTADDWHLGGGFVMSGGGDYLLTSVIASVRHVLGGNSVTLSVYDTIDGVPGNLLETSSAMNLPPHDGSDAPPTTFAFSGSTVLLDGATYWVIASTDGPGGAWLAWSWNSTGDFGLHGQRQGMGPWQVFPNFERVVMRVEGTLIDDPGVLGDLNGDGVVNVSDLLVLLAAWGECPRGEACPADLNDDGVVNVGDLLILLANWG